MEGSGWENYQWKVLRGKINSVTKVKTPHGFPSHSGVGFWKVLVLGLFFGSP